MSEAAAKPRPYLRPPCGVPPPEVLHHPILHTRYSQPSLAPVSTCPHAPCGLRPRLLRSRSPCQQFPHAAPPRSCQPAHWSAGQRVLHRSDPLSLRASVPLMCASCPLVTVPACPHAALRAALHRPHVPMPTCPHEWDALRRPIRATSVFGPRSLSTCVRPSVPHHIAPP